MTSRKSGWSTESRQSRGYGNNWLKLRLVILRRDNGLCQCERCKGGRHGGRLTRATEVHHIKSKARGGDDSPSNLQAVNKDCHKRITAAEMGRKIKPRIGLDGYALPELHL